MYSGMWLQSFLMPSTCRAFHKAWDLRSEGEGDDLILLFYVYNSGLITYPLSSQV